MTSQSFTVGDLATRVGGRVVGEADQLIQGVNALTDAGPHDVTFMTSEAWSARFVESKAGAALVSEAHAPTLPAGSSKALIVVPNAELALATVLSLFEPAPDRPEVGIHPTAVVHPSARVGQGVSIGPYVTIGRDCVVGDGAVLHSGVRLYAGCEIGAGTEIHANCVLRERSVIGARVILHQNVSIGADGFGYRMSADKQGLVKIPHVGNVIIEDDVEIGAGSCVDRGKFGATRIGRGTKIDNLCQIAHNCVIGRSCVIAALTGIAGSVTVGDGCRLGGNVGISDHVTLGRGVSVAAKSGVMKDIPDGQNQAGLPAEDARQTLRQIAALRKLPDLLKRLAKAD